MKIILSLIVVMMSAVCTAKDIQVSDTGISFVAPDEFQPLSQDLIDAKWPQKSAPIAP